MFEKKYFEMRLESIGGLGANLAGKLLGELGAVYLGFNAASFAEYGSEKRGSPVKSYVRYSDRGVEIRINSPVTKPDILVVFHENLAGKHGIMTGVSEKTKVIVNTDKNAEFIRDKLKMHSGELYCIDALGLAMKNKTRVNMVLIGAVAKASGFMPIEKVNELIKETIGKKYPLSLKSNLAGILSGYENALPVKIDDDGKYPYVPYQEIKREWGYENAPIGGVNPAFGSSVSNDLTASREGYVPLFDKEKCINCGLCDTTCPDMVYQFVMGEYKGRKSVVNLGPDYTYCKGCMRCVEVCPTHAITSGVERESEDYMKKTNVKNVELNIDPGSLEIDKVGQNSWVESVSYTVNSTE